MKLLTSFLIYLFILCMFFGACSSIPEKAVAVHPFDINQYLGKWYEIARFDFRFERDLNQTTATYSMNKDGSVKVLNRGYNYKTKEWKEAEGKAKFAGSDTVAMLKVSFFGPFYAGYNVLALDSNYQYALVGGSSLDYLWILSRETSIPDSIKTAYLKIAQDIGYDTQQLLWVEHTPQ